MLALLKAPAVAGYMLVAASACPAQPPAKLVFDFTSKEPSVVTTVSPTELARMHRKHGGETDGRMSGLTISEFNRKLSFQAQLTPVKGGACLAPVKVVASVEFEPTVYISSAYRPGSCKFRVTRMHEMQHVRISMATLEEHAHTIMVRLRKAVAGLHTERAVSKAEAKRTQARMLKSLSKSYADVMAEMERTLAKRQARIDTEEEYRRVSALCSD